MEAIIFCGIQATGKTTFFKEFFFRTHLHISLDVLNTRNKEQKFINTCFETYQRYVVDNTNPTKESRAKYIAEAKANKYKVIGYYFQSEVKEALYRNSQRLGKEHISEIGIKATSSKLEIPTFGEGFDQLYRVEIKDNKFIISEISDISDEI